MKNLNLNCYHHPGPSVLGVCHSRLHHCSRCSPWGSRISITLLLVRNADVISYLDCQLSHAFLLSAKSNEPNLRNAHVRLAVNVKLHVLQKNFFRIAEHSRAIHCHMKACKPYGDRSNGRDLYAKRRLILSLPIVS